MRGDADPFIRDLMYVLVRGLRQVTKSLGQRESG